MNLDKIIPLTGEWTLSPNPDQFIVVLNNDTPYIKQHDRVAIVCELGDVVAPGNAPDSNIQQVKIKMLQSVDGRNPGGEIEFTPECNDFCQLVARRIGDALNKWGEETTEDEKAAIWSMGNLNPMEMLLKSLNGKFSA